MSLSNMLDFARNIGPTEIIVISFILMLLFGRKVLVGIAKSAGETFKEAKKVKTNFKEVVDEVREPLTGKKEVSE